MGIDQLTESRLRPIWEKIDNPATCLVCFLLPSFLYFSDLQNWWLVQLSLQFGLCLIGFFIPSWRLYAVVGFFILLFTNLTWFQPDPNLPEICQNRTDYVSGVATRDAKSVGGSIYLIKTELDCGPSSRHFPGSRIILGSSGKKQNLWFRVGDRIEIRNPRVLDATAYFIRVELTEKSKISNLSHFDRIAARGKLLLYIQTKAGYYLGNFTSAIFKAITTADRTDISKKWKTGFQELGISHLFAISGLHIGFIYLWLSFSIRLILSVLIVRFEKGSFLILADMVSLIAIIVFLQIIGTPISAARATIMLGWWMLVRYFLNWQPLWVILLGTAFVILLITPEAIGQLAFQLSFISVAGIIHILPALPKRDYRNKFTNMAWRTILASVMITGWLFLLNLPLLSKIATSFSLLAIVNNVVHISFFSIVFLPISFISVGITAVSYPFYGFPLEFYLFNILNFLGKLWEWLLLQNLKINRYFMVSYQWSWRLVDVVIYWSMLLFFSAMVIRQIKKQKK